MIRWNGRNYIPAGMKPLLNRKTGANVPGMPKTKWIASWVGGVEETSPVPPPTPSISVTPSITPSITPSVTPSNTLPEPPLNCCVYDVYTGSTLEDVCIDCNTTYTNIYADALFCENILSNKMKDNCGGTPLPNNIYFYLDGDPTTIYKTTGGDGTVVIEICPTYNIETEDGEDIIAENNDELVWFEPECVTPLPTPSVTITPTSSISVTPSISVSATPSITITPSVTISPSSTVTPSVTVSPTSTVTPSISVSATPSVSITPSITPSISEPEPPLSCCVYDVYTGATLEDVCIDCNTTYKSIYADAVFCENVLSNKMKDNCGGSPLPNDIYFYFDGDPTTIYKTTGGDGTIVVETCPTYNIETEGGEDILAENNDELVWFEPECIPPSPTPSVSITPTPSISVTPSVSVSVTPTPSASVVTNYLLTEDTDVVEAENGDLIEY